MRGFDYLQRNVESAHAKKAFASWIACQRFYKGASNSVKQLTLWDVYRERELEERKITVDIYPGRYFVTG